MKTYKIGLFIFIMILSFSCRKEVVGVGGYGLDDWSVETHSSDASPNYSTVFPQNKVNRLDIVFDNAYWQIMQENLEEIIEQTNGIEDENPIYIPCQIYHNGKQWYDVGIRYKGNSSLRTAYNAGVKKLPFRLEFAHFEDEKPCITGQTFHGFNQLLLVSNFKDVSFLHEKVAADVFRSFGVPATQTAFYRIYIDYGEGQIYFGLYTMVEIVFDKPMLESQFGNNTGNCYKPDGEGAKCNNISLVTSEFFPNKTNADAPLDDIMALVNVLMSDTRNLNPSQWRTNLETVFNVENFLKWLAANTTMQNKDTYGNKTHNFYLYNDPSTQMLNWISWDNNLTFSESAIFKKDPLDFDFSNLEEPENGNSDAIWPLIRYIYDDTEYRSMYDAYLSEFINGPFSSSNMDLRLTEAHNLINQYVVGTDGEINGYTFLSSDSEFENSLNNLIEHVSSRIVEAKKYLNQ